MRNQYQIIERPIAGGKLSRDFSAANSSGWPPKAARIAIALLATNSDTFQELEQLDFRYLPR